METPIAGAPITIDSHIERTDNDGRVAANLSVSEQHSISSGLEAIYFSQLYESGSSLAARSPVILSGERLVSSDKPPCRVVVAGVQNLYFGTLNLTDHNLSIPLEYESLNSIESVSGDAVPADLFAPGTSGFAVPETHLSTPDGLYGVWNFLGQRVPVPMHPEICSDAVVPGECRNISDSELFRPIQFTRRAIIRMVRQTNRAAYESGRLIDVTTQFNRSFRRRSAGIVTRLKRKLVRGTGSRFTCDVGPMACTQVHVSRSSLIRMFSRIYEVRFPKGLEHFKKIRTQEMAEFKASVGSTPLDYFVCSSSAR